MIEIRGKYTTAYVMIDAIDEATSSQIHALVNHVAFTNPIYIMPDTHYGKGAVIGFTMEMGNKIIPNIVGVDINCGMLTFEIDEDPENVAVPEKYCAKADSLIRKQIPFGTDVHTDNSYDYKIDKEFPWKRANEEVRKFTMAFNKRYNTRFDVPKYNKDWFRNKCDQIGMDMRRAIRSIGTLGGGNHFIEIGRCEEGKIWVTIHSGSRQFGQKIATYWQNIAAKIHTERNHVGMSNEVTVIKATYPKSMWQSRLLQAREKYRFVPKGLEYLEGPEMFDYLTDMVFTQIYAEENRRLIKELLISALSLPKEKDYKYITCSHNYIDFRDFIIRKGAVSAYADEFIIIPFNMEDGTLICKGKGNADWNYSAPHGAGRLMARGVAKEDAKKKGTLQKAKIRMEEKGIYASHLPADELREAYKDPKIIEEAIKPTATIVRRIKPIIAIKD